MTKGQRARPERDSSNENLHEVRIELKRLQCACEVLGLVAGKPAVKVARAAETTQTKLGVVHDEAVAARVVEVVDRRGARVEGTAA